MIPSYVRLYFKNVTKEMQSEIEGADQLWTRCAAPGVCLFQNKVMFLLKIMLILWRPSIEQPTSNKRPFACSSRVGLNGGSAAYWDINSDAPKTALYFLISLYGFSPLIGKLLSVRFLGTKII